MPCSALANETECTLAFPILPNQSPSCVLSLQGCSQMTTTLVTPLFFGAAHLHHLHDLLTHQRVAPAHAMRMVGCAGE